MKKILFVRSNPVFPDPRVEKEAKSLSKRFKVKILAWDRTGGLEKEVIKKNYSIKRFTLKTPYGTFEVFFKLILWFFYELIYLIKADYDIIHSCDFDTLLPAVIISKIRNKKLVYDCFDFYSDSIPIKIPSYIKNFIKHIEIYSAKKADLVILPDPERIKQFNNEINPLIIYNTPEEIKYPANKDNKKSFEIFFAGAIYEGRGLDKLVSATKNMDKVKITIAGYSADNSRIIDSIKTAKNVEFLGKISYDEVIKRTFNCDVVFALYDPKIPNHKYSSPNKLFEAMMCGKPIIVSNGTLMAKNITKENFGLIVDYGNIEELAKNIITLKNNPELRKKLGKNGRKAYERKYSWSLMESKLLKFYNQL